MQADRALHPRRSKARAAARIAGHTGPGTVQLLTGVPAHPLSAEAGPTVDIRLLPTAALPAQLRTATAVLGKLVGVALSPLAQHANQCRAGSVPVRVVRRCTQSLRVGSLLLLAGTNAIVAPSRALLPAKASRRDVVQRRPLCRGRCTPKELLLRRRCFAWRCNPIWIRRGRYTRWVRNHVRNHSYRNMHSSAACRGRCTPKVLLLWRHPRRACTAQGRGVPGRSTTLVATAPRRCTPVGGMWRSQTVGGCQPPTAAAGGAATVGVHPSQLPALRSRLRITSSM